MWTGYVATQEGLLNCGKPAQNNNCGQNVQNEDFVQSAQNKPRLQKEIGAKSGFHLLPPLV